MSYKYDVFLSYSSADREWADSLAKALAAHGLRVWSAQSVVHISESIADKISEGLRDSRIIVILISNTSVSSPWITFELGAALGLGKKVIPIISNDMRIEQLPGPLGIRARKQMFLIMEEPENAAKRLAAELVNPQQ